LKNFATKKNYYIVIFEIIQLIDSKKRAQEIYQTTIIFINKVSVRKSTTSQHVFDNEISKIKNIKKKKRKSKERKSFKKIKKIQRKISRKNSRKNSNKL